MLLPPPGPPAALISLVCPVAPAGSIEYGLYGAFVPCIAYALLGSSRQLAVGEMLAPGCPIAVAGLPVGGAAAVSDTSRGALVLHGLHLTGWSAPMLQALWLSPRSCLPMVSPPPLAGSTDPVPLHGPQLVLPFCRLNRCLYKPCLCGYLIRHPRLPCRPREHHRLQR